MSQNRNRICKPGTRLVAACRYDCTSRYHCNAISHLRMNLWLKISFTPSKVEVKSSNFAKRNEKDFLRIEKQYSGITLPRYTSFAIQLHKLHSIFRFEEKRL